MAFRFCRWADRQLLAVGEQCQVELCRFRRRAAVLTADDPAGAMPRDGAQPACKLRRMLQLRQRLEGQQKCLLRDIFRRWTGTQHLFRDQRDGDTETPNQLIERLQIAQQREDDQLFVNHMRKSVLFHRIPNMSVSPNVFRNRETVNFAPDSRKVENSACFLHSSPARVGSASYGGRKAVH